tara:strand:+ start:393 stop:584 length:192 start_codon:yes stop_codon:yes gene_type:complete
MTKLLKNTKSTKSATQILLAIGVLSVIATHAALNVDLSETFSAMDTVLDRGTSELITNPTFAD